MYRNYIFSCVFTWRRTLAVSRGKVRASAIQAAVPAVRNLEMMVGEMLSDAPTLWDDDGDWARTLNSRS